MLQIVGEADPQEFYANFDQAPHMELPQAEFAFDPRVAKLHDSSTAAVLRLRFFAGHLLLKGQHSYGGWPGRQVRG